MFKCVLLNYWNRNIDLTFPKSSKKVRTNAAYWFIFYESKWQTKDVADGRFYTYFWEK